MSESGAVARGECDHYFGVRYLPVRDSIGAANRLVDGRTDCSADAANLAVARYASCAGSTFHRIARRHHRTTVRTCQMDGRMEGQLSD